MPINYPKKQNIDYGARVLPRRTNRKPPFGSRTIETGMQRTGGSDQRNVYQAFQQDPVDELFNRLPLKRSTLQPPGARPPIETGAQKTQPMQPIGIAPGPGHPDFVPGPPPVERGPAKAPGHPEYVPPAGPVRAKLGGGQPTPLGGNRLLAPDYDPQEVVRQRLEEIRARRGNQGGQDVQQQFQQDYQNALSQRLDQNLGNQRQARLDGIGARLGQPQQRLDGAAALQGRLTATGAQYPASNLRDVTLDNFQPGELLAATELGYAPFGTAEDKNRRAMEASGGTLGMGSTVTIDPETGRATVQGNLPSRRLAELGVDTEYDPDTGERTVTDRSRMHARRAANLQRMQNAIQARRMGMGSQVPTDPVQPGTGISEIQGNLDTQRQLRDFLGEEKSKQQRGRPQVPGVTRPEEPKDAGKDELAQQRERKETMGGLTQTFAEQIATGQMTMDDISRMADQMLGRDTEGSGTPIPKVARDEVADMDAVEAERWLTDNKYPKDVIDQIVQEKLAEEELTPAEKEKKETALRRQKANRSAGYNTMFGSPPASSPDYQRRHFPKTRDGVIGTGFYGGMP